MSGWLVLTRKSGEMVRIGNVIVRVVIFPPDERGERVKLAILAPDDVDIVRGELPAANRDGLLGRAMKSYVPEVR